MSIELWLAFAAASAVLLVIPGPTILTVISYSMAAVALADSAFLFIVVKWVGGLYLLYLGIKLLRASISSTELAPPSAPGSRWS